VAAIALPLDIITTSPGNPTDAIGFFSNYSTEHNDQPAILLLSSAGTPDPSISATIGVPRIITAITAEVPIFQARCLIPKSYQ
jgi:hypothetical protein